MLEERGQGTDTRKGKRKEEKTRKRAGGEGRE
jgi:hypothetical protein